MTENQLILHQYDISPFSQKAQKMMGLKGLDWLSVEMPLIAPKPDVEAKDNITLPKSETLE